MKIGCVAALLALSSAAWSATREELVRDGEFENPKAGAWTIADDGKYSLRKGEGYNGTCALYWENADTNAAFRPPCQYIKAEPGKVYCYSCRIRTENLNLYEPGVAKPSFAAQVCIEWQDETGRTVGGNYAPGLRSGTSEDWKTVQWVTPPLPTNAVRVMVIPYAQRRATGKVWFDDVSVVEYGRDPVEGIHSSAYRNSACAGRVDFRAVLAIPAKYRLQDLKATFVHKDAAGAKVRVPIALDSRETALWSCDVAQLPLGESGVGFELRTDRDEVLGRAALTFNRTAAPVRRKVAFDALGRTLVDGVPFFPLGMFISNRDGRDEYAAGPFNCVMSYARQTPAEMDWWHERGKKVIYCIKDIYSGTGGCPGGIRTPQDEEAFIRKKIAEVGRHPALLAWYINDEFPVSYIPRMAERRNLMERLDPEHPAWAVQYQIDQLRDYLPIYDVIGTDPYPVSGKPLEMVAEWTRKTRESSFGMRPIWQVPQAFDWNAYRKGRAGDRMPTCEEMRSMTWQAIAEGANGLIYYSFTGLRKPGLKTPFAVAWQDVTRVAAEVRKYIPVLLAGDKAPSVRGAPRAWSVRTWREGNTVWLLVVNAQAASAEATCTLAEPFGKVVAEFGPDPVTVGGKSVTLSLKPYEPALYRLEAPTPGSASN